MFVILVLFFIISCNIFEPSYLLVKNSSDYDIRACCIQTQSKEIKIERKKSDYFLVYPGECKLEIYIKELDLKKDYQLYFSYHEKKEFSFNLK